MIFRCPNTEAFGTNGKLMVVGVVVLKHFRVYSSSSYKIDIDFGNVLVSNPKNLESEKNGSRFLSPPKVEGYSFLYNEFVWP